MLIYRYSLPSNNLGEKHWEPGVLSGEKHMQYSLVIDSYIIDELSYQQILSVHGKVLQKNLKWYELHGCWPPLWTYESSMHGIASSEKTFSASHQSDSEFIWLGFTEDSFPIDGYSHYINKLKNPFCLPPKILVTAPTPTGERM